jgi:alpha-D-xyloside xylohydrolase
MMRSHGTDTPRELWYYGEEGDWAYDAMKKMIDLRYSLLPYIYSTSWDVSKNNSTMMRALMMDFAGDKDALDIDDQYMFGKNILVCPVTEPMYVGYRKDRNRYFAEKEDFSKSNPLRYTSRQVINGSISGRVLNWRADRQWKERPRLIFCRSM